MELICKHIVFSLLYNVKDAFPSSVLEDIWDANSSPSGPLAYRVNQTIKKYRGRVNRNNESYKRMILKNQFKSASEAQTRKQKKRRIVFHGKVIHLFVFFFI